MVARVEKGPSPDVWYSPEFNSAPFLNALLQGLRYATPPVTITEPALDSIIADTRRHEEGLIRATAVRRGGDPTTYTTHLVEFNRTRKEVRELLFNIGKRQFAAIQRLDGDFQTEVFDALDEKSASLRSIVFLDGLQTNVMRELTYHRNRSPLAMAVRTANKLAVQRLYEKKEGLQSVFDQYTPNERRRVLYTGKPRICYVPSVLSGAVHSINHYFFYPKTQGILLDEEVFAQLFADYPKFRRFEPQLREFNGQSVKQVLEAVLPEEIRQENLNDQPKPASWTVWDVLARLGKGGHPINQGIAEKINRDAEAGKLAREQGKANELFAEYIRTHG